jgi:serine/threonine-protein kinase HipA
MALLKIAEPGDRKFHSVRMAPLYDAVTTRVFPNLKHDRLALKLNGKDKKMRRADFRAFAGVAGIRTSEADAAMDEMLERLAQALGRIALPKALAYSAEGAERAEEVLAICRGRIESFA